MSGHRSRNWLRWSSKTAQPTGFERRWGLWFGLVSDAKAGMTYRYRLDGKDSFPDPCSRFQPEGPHGPSLIVDPGAFSMEGSRWPGIHMHGQVIYELHIGTFTPGGTFDSAIKELDELKRLGITVIEVMPVAEFPGPMELGIRRGRSVRAGTCLWRSRGAEAICRCGTSTGARCHFGRGLQPSGTRWKLSSGIHS